MKPSIFIGSSVEGLDVAYAIQDNLSFDANVTIWNQGVFELAHNTIDSLLKVVNASDFGIFVFKPDDITNIKDDLKHTVRDNVLFELGLFIGKLGKEKVFFVVPNNTKDFHLPSDLLGITSGQYDNHREDGNLRAALGSFCNQVRVQFKNYTYNSLNDLQSESKEAKRIAIEKPSCWEYLLSAELLEYNLVDVNKNYEELYKNLVFIKTKRLSGDEFASWYHESIDDLMRMANVIMAQFKEFNNSFGPIGVSGNILEIKTAVNHLVSLSKELIAWEYRLQEVEPPSELNEIKTIMKGWSRIIFDNINIIPTELRRVVDSYLKEDQDQNIQKINMNFVAPPGLIRTTEVLAEYYKNR